MELNILKPIPQYGVLLCKMCDEPHCIPPAAIAAHLRDFHKAVLTKKQRKELVKFSKTLRLLEPKEVLIPPREQGPVEGLHRSNGYECLECGFVCRKETTIQQHCRPAHKWDVNKADMWKRQYIQAFLLFTASF